jgi:hypothetical protein
MGYLTCGLVGFSGGFGAVYSVVDYYVLVDSKFIRLLRVFLALNPPSKSFPLLDYHYAINYDVVYKLLYPPQIILLLVATERDSLAVLYSPCPAQADISRAFRN